MKTFILSITLCLLSSICSAEMIDKYNASISVVYVNNAGVYLMKIIGIDGWLNIGKAGDPVADALYSTALAAKLSNQCNLWVRYWTNDSDPAAYPTVGIISIH